MWILRFFKETNRNQVFPIFEHVLSRLLNVMNIINFAFGKLQGLVKPWNYNTNAFRPGALLKRDSNIDVSCEIWEIFQNTFSRLLSMVASYRSKFEVLKWKLTDNQSNMKLVLNEPENVPWNAKQTTQGCCMRT